MTKLVYFLLVCFWQQNVALNFHSKLSRFSNLNKTGLQPVSRPVEQVHYLGGWSGGSKSLWWHCSKFYKVQRLCHRQTCYQTSWNRIGQIWPKFYVVLTHLTGFWGLGIHFWSQKKICVEKNLCFKGNNFVF